MTDARWVHLRESVALALTKRWGFASSTPFSVTLSGWLGVVTAKPVNEGALIEATKRVGLDLLLDAQGKAIELKRLGTVLNSIAVLELYLMGSAEERAKRLALVSDIFASRHSLSSVDLAGFIGAWLKVLLEGDLKGSEVGVQLREMLPSEARQIPDRFLARILEQPTGVSNFESSSVFSEDEKKDFSKFLGAVRGFLFFEETEPSYSRIFDFERTISGLRIPTESQLSLGGKSSSGDQDSLKVSKLAYQELQLLGEALAKGSEKFDALRLQNAIARLMDVPLKQSLNRLVPMVKEVSDSLGKQARLQIAGDDLLCSREDVDLLSDSLVHIVRNAVDHGIEKPEDRASRNKPAVGTISIHLRKSDSHREIVIQDDGGGIDPQAVARKALKMKIFTEDQIKSMSDEQIIQIVFRPEFSTKESATDLSGRGVGMDVVKSNVERIGGALELKSQTGRGTTISLRF